MNVLLDKLPDTVMVSGFEIPINSDHRSAMRAIIALSDDDNIADTDQTLLDAMYPDLPAGVDAEDAFYAAAEFLMGAPVPTLPTQKGKAPTHERAYSFVYDQERILAAFYQQYRIDLTKETLHWWVFRALLGNLRGNSMAEIMELRTAEETAEMDKAHKNRIRKAKAKWRLPEPVSEQKHKDDLVACLKNGGVGLEALLNGGV